MGKKNKLKKKKEKFQNEGSNNFLVDVAGGTNNDRFDISKPQFRKSKETATKVVIDERFSSALTDPRFQLDIKDKYGRSKKLKSVSKNNESLDEFYTIEKHDEDRLNDNNDDDDGKYEKEEETSSSSDTNESVDKRPRHKDMIQRNKDNDEEGEEEEQDEDPVSRIAYLRALSRGELDVSSSSDEDDDDGGQDGHEQSDSDELDNYDSADDDDNDDNEDIDVMGKAGVLDPSSKEDEDIEITHEPSPYLAVMNLEWSHVRAVDIFTIVSSFVPPGAVKRVRVFPSDFGLERMAIEEKYGPVDVWKKDYTPQHKSHDTKPVLDYDDEQKQTGKDKSQKKNEIEESDYETEKEDEDSDDADHVRGDEHGFDPEKLRAYEVSKLKYYFAIVDFANPEHADLAYKEVDGIEFEHSSAAVDVRAIPVDSLESVIAGRPLRDEAIGIPSNYKPPDFIVNALQHSNVQCSWEAGDIQREKTLTKYTTGQAWESIAEKDDLKAYVGSDVSSDEEEEESDNEAKKAGKMRKMLGLDSDDDENEITQQNNSASNTASDSDSDSDNDGHSNSDSGSDEAHQSKQVTFTPGKSDIQARIRSKLESEKDQRKELTPWEKYLEKKKERRREKRQADREKRKEVSLFRKGEKFGNTHCKESFKDEFLIADSDNDGEYESRNAQTSRSQTREELELLVAGDDHDEGARDFDMRGLERIEKNKDKKLRGSRKRKEEKLAANVSGTDFQIDVTDDRFKKVLDGTDARFGIDRTDPNFKETTGMRVILQEQTRRRKKQRKSHQSTAKPDVISNSNADSLAPNAGSAALSALVMSIKSKVYAKN